MTPPGIQGGKPQPNLGLLSSKKKTSSHKRSLITSFVSVNKTHSTSTKDVTINDLAAKLDNVLKIISEGSSNKKERSSEVYKFTGKSASNIQEFIKMNEDVELLSGPNEWTLRCKICFFYLNSKAALRQAQKLPSSGSISTGLTISADDYTRCSMGHNNTWYRLKKRMLDHFSTSESKTHMDAAAWWHFTKPIRKRELRVVQNQIQTAIGVVKTKSAGRSYEERIAELYVAGADVGDYGHSRNLFNDMIKVATAFIDKKTQAFLSEPLPNTGVRPHFYVTADKSTNHKIVNQASMICVVVNGKRKAIPLGVRRVYEDASGSGGKGAELAEKLYQDLSEHVKVSEKHDNLMQMQGKVFDGQYLNEPMMTRLNAPLFEAMLKSMQFDSEEDYSTEYWWPTQWDPAHWLDKVFEAFRKESFISRLISRTNYLHQIFGFGKMHSISKETAKDLNLPYRVTVSFATQRFMSSSYNQFLKLEISLEAYIEAYRDHDNKEIGEYKIAADDFVFDLLGTIDLLWPLVLLMLRGQLQWCPGWKFTGWLPLVKEQFRKFATEIKKEKPSKNVCPRIFEHGKSISKMR